MLDWKLESGWGMDQRETAVVLSAWKRVVATNLTRSFHDQLRMEVCHEKCPDPQLHDGVC